MWKWWWRRSQIARLDEGLVTAMEIKVEANENGGQVGKAEGVHDEQRCSAVAS